MSTQESRRLEELERYQILDTPPDGSFDRIVRMLAEACEVPIAVVSLVDEDRIWFKARFGLDVDQIDRAPGLCASACFSEDLFEVSNALEDPRTIENPLVRGELGLRFYAASPLRTLDGHGLGNVAIADTKPRELTDAQRRMLELMGATVASEMQLRVSTLGNLRETGLLEDVERKRSEFTDHVRICAWTNRVYHHGDWVDFETFLQDRFGLTSTHGISPEGQELARRTKDPD